MSIEIEKLTNIVEAALLAFGQPLSIDRLMSLFGEDEQVSRQDIREALQSLQQSCEGRSVELVEVGSGFRYQARKDYAPWVSKLWEEKPPRYSRALLETLVLVAYRQPITRAEIEDIRGVSVSSHIMKTLQERDWVRVVGHKDVPGKPALYATTKAFLDYFNIKSLEELPSLMEIRDLDKISAEIDRQNAAAGQPSETSAEAQDLIEDEDIERLLPDGEADHGEGIEGVENTIQEKLEAAPEDSTEAESKTNLVFNPESAAATEAQSDTEASDEQGDHLATADSSLPPDNDATVAHDVESVQAKDGEEPRQVPNHELMASTSDEEVLSEADTSEQEPASSEVADVEAELAESDDETVAAVSERQDDAIEEDALEEADTLDAINAMEGHVPEDIEQSEYSASVSSVEEPAGALEAPLSVADNETEESLQAQTDEDQGDTQGPPFSTANYGLRNTGLRNAHQDSPEQGSPEQDDSEYAEDEQHADRLSAAESNS
jgi:segregation and condensation protein B